MRKFYKLLPGFCATALLCALVTGCEETLEITGPAPVIVSQNVAPGPHNVLSAVVSLRLESAHGAWVEFGTDLQFGDRTESVPVQGDSARIPVLGLEPQKTYHMRVVVRSIGGHQTVGAPMTFTTGALPTDIPAFTITTNRSPEPGYVMFGVTGGDTSLGGFYALVIDNAGTIVWYRKFDVQITDFQKQPNGNYTVFSSLGGAPPHFYELDPLGTVVGEYRASGGVATGPHELRLRSDGYVLFGTKDSAMDLTALGGRSDAKVKGIFVEYVRTGGSLRWSSYDNLSVDEAQPDISLTAASVNPWHGNAIDVDTDGNLLVSFRNSDMILKIDSRTGAIIWRLGGKRSDFTFVGDPLGGFSHQHGIRRLPNGNVILFDNGNLHTPTISRAVEYRLDEAAKRATMIWEYRGDASLYSFAVGFAQRMSSGGTLICFGAVGNVVEIDAAGNKQWELAMDRPEYLIYRAFRIGTLY